jgi:hypothetical protein
VGFYSLISKLKVICTQQTINMFIDQHTKKFNNQKHAQKERNILQHVQIIQTIINIRKQTNNINDNNNDKS